jgi:hypothetical protein
MIATAGRSAHPSCQPADDINIGVDEIAGSGWLVRERIRVGGRVAQCICVICA